MWEWQNLVYNMKERDLKKSREKWERIHEKRIYTQKDWDGGTRGNIQKTIPVSCYFVEGKKKKKRETENHWIASNNTWPHCSEKKK